MQALSDDELQGQDRRVPRAAWPRARRSTTCCPRRSPPAARRAAALKNMRHFDVQILGGIVLHGGNIAEMVTGEGKTLVATLAAYLNALDGKGVHVVTVNDYLARRDCEWMRPILQRPGHDRRRHPGRHGLGRAAARPTTATSPTAPTASSASTTCATT